MSRTPAESRLARLLAIVPWIASNDGPLIEEVCNRFGVSESELLADLELLFLCGVYPFTPDVLIEVDVADGRVWIRFADYFRRPLRLTPQEGLALASAASALAGLPGADPSGPLSRGLAKLQEALGVAGDDSFEVDLGPVSESVLEAMRRGREEKRKVEIDYYSFGRDGFSTRVVHPLSIFAAAGHWYARAWCENAEAKRLFRLDRISTARLLESDFSIEATERCAASPSGDGEVTGAEQSLFSPSATDLRLVLDLDPEAEWVAAQYPNESVEALPDGRLRVTLRAGERAWLERLLLRVGRYATVVEAAAADRGDSGVERRRPGQVDSPGPDIAALAAERLLGRYRRRSS